MKRIVTKPIYEGGKLYRVGQEIELSEFRARQLAHVLEPQVEAKVEAPENKMIGGKKWKFHRFDHLTKSIE